MSNNEIYDYATFAREVNRYDEQQRNNSNQKVFKALQDTIKTFDSLNELNQQEVNMYLQILFASNIKKLITLSERPYANFIKKSVLCKAL